jgi:hypothetical protein
VGTFSYLRGSAWQLIQKGPFPPHIPPLQVGTFSYLRGSAWQLIQKGPFPPHIPPLQVGTFPYLRGSAWQLIQSGRFLLIFHPYRSVPFRTLWAVPFRRGRVDTVGPFPPQLIRRYRWVPFNAVPGS